MTAKKPAFDAYRNGWKAREEGGMSAEYKLE
jgi:hypothetical protein